MAKPFRSIRTGFSLMETILVALLLGVVLLSIGVVLVGNSRAWDTVYSKANADVVTARHAAIRTFARVIRKASHNHIQVAGDQSWVEAQYYGSPPGAVPDRYALFTVNGSHALQVEFGTLNPRTAADTRILCEQVTSCLFQKTGSAVHMTLEIQTGEDSDLIVTSAVAHN